MTDSVIEKVDTNTPIAGCVIMKIYMSKVSPKPWRYQYYFEEDCNYSDDYVYDANGKRIFSSDESFGQDDWDYIIHAVNLHDHLVKALEWALDNVMEGAVIRRDPATHKIWMDSYENSNGLLAEAKGGTDDPA